MEGNYRIPPRMRMRKRTVLSDKELLEQFSDEKFPEDPDIGRACFENLLTGKRGKGTLPHLGTPEEFYAAMEKTKRRLGYVRA